MGVKGNVAGAGGAVGGDLLAAVRLMRQGLPAVRALELGIVNKCFDEFERQLVADVVQGRVPEDLSGGDVFNG